MSKIVEVKPLKESDKGEFSSNSRSISKMGEIDRFTPEQLDELKLIHPGMANFSVLNGFRELRTQLIQHNSKKNFVCLVSSVCQGGGASHISRNLASVFALDKEKTSLLIDANLYKPSQEELIIGEAKVGITDYLSSSELQVKDIVYATGIPRLRVVPIGTSSEGAAEYFSSEKMRACIDQLKDRYPDRYIFIDSPPVTSSSEARILLEVADMVVLVVPHGMVTESSIASAIDVVGAKQLAGLVYNNA